MGNKNKSKNPVPYDTGLFAFALIQSGDVLLSHGETPHYHRRCIVSLLSSGWDQVVPMLYGRQEILCTSPSFSNVLMKFVDFYINKTPVCVSKQGFWNLILTMTYSHMGKPHTTIGDASFHY